MLEIFYNKKYFLTLNSPQNYLNASEGQILPLTIWNYLISEPWIQFLLQHIPYDSALPSSTLFLEILKI